MRIWNGIPILIFLLFVSGFNTANAVVEEESNFFVDFLAANPQFALGGAENATDPCTWLRVTCSDDGNNVISIDWSGRGTLINTIPASIGNLTKLTSLVLLGAFVSSFPAEIALIKNSLVELNLAETHFTNETFSSVLSLTNLRRLILGPSTRLQRLPNNFGSSFPYLEELRLSPATIALPPDFGSLRSLRVFTVLGARVPDERMCDAVSLEEIYMSGATFTALPDCIDRLQRLRVLDLSHSRVLVFPNIYSSVNLEELRIHGTTITGELDPMIGNLVNLRILNANGALLRGTIPDTITNLVNLERIDFNQNLLEGTLPSNIGNMRSLRTLTLFGNSFTGTIPDSILNCTQLRDIVLSGNQISGTIPPFTNPIFNSIMLDDNLLTGTIPASLGSISALSTLSFDNNQLSGTLPEELGHLPQVQVIRMENNQVTGTLPQSFRNLSTLIELMLGFNEFEGPIAPFRNMTRLRRLSLQFNSFGGTIPDVFDQMPVLQSVLLQSNNFSGSVPQTLVGRSYTEVNLSNNRLSGTLPTGLLECVGATAIDLSYNRLTGPLIIRDNTTRCSVLQLQHNDLTGTIPAIMGPSLEFLDLSSNLLSGPLPRLSFRLTSFNLARNGFTGTFPEEYLTPGLLTSIDISNNFLTGTLPAFPQNSNLRHLDLSFNILSGTIPHSILTNSIQNVILSFNQFTGQVPRFNPFIIGLHTLRLNHNRLHGGISPAMFLPNIQIIDLSSNVLTGILPTLNARPRMLRELRLGMNLFSGVIPPTFANMGMLETLDLSFNRIVGQIPPQLSAISTLREFIVSGNGLSGNIPQSFVNLRALEVLDVTLNRLDGTFPAHVGDIYTLQRLFMSHNQLHGTIPLLFESLRAITELDLSSNRLSGEIPPSLFNLQRVARINLARNALSGTVPSSITNLRTLEFIDISNNRISGTIPSLSNLRNLRHFDITFNSFSGCIQLPEQFEVSNNRTATCGLARNNFCCAHAEYVCDFTERCSIQQLLRVPQGARVLYEHADSFDKLYIEKGGTLVIKYDHQIEVECATVEGTIEIDMQEFDEEQYDSPFLYFSCGDTSKMTVKAEGKICSVVTNVREQSGKRLFTATVTCPDMSLDRGVVIAIVISVTGGCALFIAIGGVTYRYFRGKRRVEQLLNRVELLTLTTKNGSDDQFSLPQWHAPEDYSLKPVEDLPIQLTNTKFDFGTKGNLLQVDSMYKDTFKIQPRTKASRSRGLIERLLEKSLRVNFHPVQSTKYQLTIDPFEVDVRDKGQVDVTLMLQMKMTTRTNISLWVEVPELKQFSLLEFVCASEPSPWIDIDEVDGVTEALGEGGFGAVYKARYRGQTIAFKKLKFQDMNIQQFEEFNREVQMMMNLHHRCIVQFIGASKVPGKLAILTEFVSGGNLQELLNSRPLDTGLKLKIALDVAEALQFLHANNILHRDIKAENVLVASTAKEASVNVKLTDFGTARSIVEEVTMKFTKGVGTPTYMAPEIMENKRYEKGADIYSFGILLWTIMAQQMPYSHLEHPWQVANMVLEGKRLPIPPTAPVAVAELINKCWAQSPDDRPNMDQVVKELNFLLSSKI